MLVDMAPQMEAEGARRIQAFMNQKPEGFDTLQEVADAIANYQPHRPRPRLLDGLAKNVRLGADGKYHWHWDPARRRSWGDRKAYRERLHACADHLNLPTLLVGGGLSDVLSEAGAQSFLKQCPHAEYVNVANAAHMVAGDRNDIFAESVIAFLERVRTGAMNEAPARRAWDSADTGGPLCAIWRYGGSMAVGPLALAHCQHLLRRAEQACG